MDRTVGFSSKSDGGCGGLNLKTYGVLFPINERVSGGEEERRAR